jgi:hypothetical protein
LTDVLERLDEPIPSYVPADDVGSNDRSARTAFAALAVGGGVIHLAMAPGHLGESTLLGAGFIVAGWVQLTSAWLAVAKPSRRLWLGAIALNIVLVATWAVARTAGLPLSGHAGEVEDITIVDLTTVVLEVGAILFAIRLLLFRGGRSIFLGVGVPVIALVAASVALASPDARGHGDAGHGHEAATPELAALQEKGFGTFMNGHEHGQVQVVLDPTTQAELDRQMAITSEVATMYPTVQDALDAGYRHAGPYVPGIGFHMIRFAGDPGYLNADGVVDDNDLRHPLGLMYAGEHPDSELGGMMYYAATAVEPEGFPGRNDGWHYHDNLCAVPSSDGFFDFPFGPDFGATKAQCDTVDGQLIDSNWMVHVWTVPGWDDMTDFGGVFAEMHPGFGCSDGTYYSLPFERWNENPLNTCVSGASGQPEV